jgi:hypothetical protein
MTLVETERRASPYQGLVPFGRDDWKFFFGRDRDTDLVVANLYAEPLTLLYGATGVGKTSTLRAGVLHRLDDEDDAVAVTFDSWQGRGDARRGLRDAISTAWNGTPDHQRSMLEAAEGLVERSSRNVMIILDQFEEYFLYHRSGDPLDDELAELLTQRELPVSCLLSLREDALAALDRFKESVPELFDNILRFHHLDHDSAIEAIVRPLERYSEEYRVRARAARKLPERVVGDLERVSRDRFVWGPDDMVGESPRIETPYLQLIMDELWRAEQRDGSYTIHTRTLDRLGGTNGIVHGYLDSRLGALDEDQQDTASRIFRFLVTPSGSKIALTKDDLVDFAELPATTIAPVLEALVTSGWLLRRILPPDGNPERARYELVHDILAEEVADWRKRRLERVAEAERLKEHGTTLGEVTEAYLRRRREEAGGTLSAETDSRYAAQLAAFAQHEGQIVSAWFGDSGNAIVLIRRQPSGRRRFGDPAWKLRWVVRGALLDDRVKRLLYEGDALATAASESVSAEAEELIVRQIYALYSVILSATERQDTELDAVVEAASDQLEQSRAYTERAGARAAQLTYVKGLALGLVGVLGVVGMALLIVHLTGEVTPTANGFAMGAAVGATGATVSVLQRLTSGVRMSYPVSARGVVLTVATFRPVIGALSGLSLYALVGSGLLPWPEPDDLISFAGLAFLGGFSERFAQDFVVSTGSALQAPAKEEAERQPD